MTIKSLHTALWSTASFTDGDDTLPADLNDLTEHLGSCRQPNGRMHFLRQAGHGASTYFLGHMVTSIAVLLLLSGLISMAL